MTVNQFAGSSISLARTRSTTMHRVAHAAQESLGKRGIADVGSDLGLFRAYGSCLAIRGSYWQEEANWQDRWHDSALPGRATHAILGGGLSGLSTAIEIARLEPKATIVVLEAFRMGYGASGRNAGFLSPIAAPIWLASADRNPDHAWGLRQINHRVHEVAAWLASEVSDARVRTTTLRLCSAGRMADAGVAEMSRALGRAGLEHELEPNELHRGHSMLTMKAFTVHPYRLVRGLAEHAAHAGVLLRERARCRSVEKRGNETIVHLASGETLVADSVVVCTNAYTSSISLGERIRALPVHSFMGATPLLSEATASAMTSLDAFTVEMRSSQPYYRLAERRLFYGAMDKLLVPPSDGFSISPKLHAELGRLLNTSFGQEHALSLAHTWSGTFHATLSGLPIIRVSKKNPSVVLNVGYGGTGVGFTLACARLAAALATGGRFENADDRKFHSLLATTPIPVRGGARGALRVLRGALAPRS